MPLSAGTRLGPYEILAPIGAGGMGEVYKARDTRLDRIVAVKVSKTDFSERFEREARSVAALNHSHICQLYDVGPKYLVMEFIEGTQLKGPLPLEQAVAYAGQILEALDAAHRKGITHRDLKPANILVTKQGIKLLDFGLAKQSGPLQEADSTLTAALTRQGAIVGTLQYMAPEQLQGKDVDARSDLFSFGCVLYEMLTGKRAFEGQSAASVIAAILEREPAPLEVSLPLDRVVRRCLAKDPDQRFQTACDLKAALTWTLEPSPPSTVTMAKSRLLWTRVAGSLAIVAAIALVGLWYSTRLIQPTPQPLVRIDADLGTSVSLASIAGADVILAPDGSRLVYCSQSRLFTRRLDQTEANELAGTQGAWAPFFSPDGQWVAFFASGVLKKIPVQGGTAITLCYAPFGHGGSWGEDGNIFAALSGTSVLSRIPSAGGAPSPVTELAPGEVAHRWPQVLAGGRTVLFSSYTSTDRSEVVNIEVMSLADRRRKTLHQGGAYGRYLPSGHLVYINNGKLFAVPFDLDRLEVRGAPVPVLDELAYNPAVGSAQFDFSRAGTLIYRPGGVNGGHVTVQWLDALGKRQPLLATPGDYVLPRLSPDGSRLALASGGDIWVYEWKRDTMTRLTFDGSDTYPLWSPDGRFIAFHGARRMYWIRADGGMKPQAFLQSKNAQYPWSFTADGKRLAFAEMNPESGFDLWTLPLESDGEGLRAGKPEILLQTPFDERQPCFTSDGRWLAYSSNESGTFQVYVQALPGGVRSQAASSSRKWQISNSGGQYPVWSRNGRELFFRSVDNQIMVVAYTVKDNSFVADKPRLWSEERLATVFGWTFDVAPDGKRIAAVMSAEGPEGQKAQNHLIFLLNFFDELRRSAPTGGK